MHKIEIEYLGPIVKCALEEKEFLLLTGPQASGKSTVAKALFFFRTVKEDILTLLLKRASNPEPAGSFHKNIETQLRGKFLQIFGSSWGMNPKMRMKYFYARNTYIELYLVDSKNPGEANYIWIEFSRNLHSSFKHWEETVWTDYLSDLKDKLKCQLAQLFHDPYETVFIPAGRSMLTLLTTQLNYIFTTLDESQRRTIDYCTQTYIERILRLKPLFVNGMQGLLFDKRNLTQDEIDEPVVSQAIALIDSVLKGKYAYVGGEERLELENGKYVKINFASSGQQESVWIFNLFFYYLLEKKPVFFILEEPESHLYPDAQKAVAEMVGLLLNAKNSALITTHSPYFLGELNNLLLAGKISNAQNREQVALIVSEQKQLHVEMLGAYAVSNGVLTSCVEKDLGLIHNEVIDGASVEINRENDALYEIASPEIWGETND